MMGSMASPVLVASTPRVTREAMLVNHPAMAGSCLVSLTNDAEKWRESSLVDKRELLRADCFSPLDFPPSTEEPALFALLGTTPRFGSSWSRSTPGCMSDDS